MRTGTNSVLFNTLIVGLYPYESRDNHFIWIYMTDFVHALYLLLCDLL